MKFTKRTIIIAAILAIALLGGGAGAAYVTGMLDKLLAKQGAEHAEGTDADGKPLPKPAVFYDLPDVVVSLNGAQATPSFLKLRVSLELETAEDAQRIEQLTPRILDFFQMYLRELRPDDLDGSAGTFRLREALLRRINAAVEPTRVDDVLLVEMLVQ